MQYESSGFWRRVGAFLIDSIILGVLGLILGLFFYHQFAGLGGWGRAIGFLIAALYFIILNSRIGGGQTIGKRALKIQVVDKEGELIHLPKSILRYSAIGIPYFLNGAMIPETFLYPISIFIISLLIFGFGFSIVYLIIFNRNTRQSLYDLITGTYVVRKDIASIDSPKPVWVVHYVICGAVIIFALVAPIFIGKLGQNEFFLELTKTRNHIQKEPQVIYATIQDGKTTFAPLNGESTVTTYLSSQVLINNQNVEDEKLASKIAYIIIDTQKEANQRDVIQVVLTYGYDIGIASSWRNYRYSYPPEQWREKKN